MYSIKITQNFEYIIPTLCYDTHNQSYKYILISFYNNAREYLQLVLYYILIYIYTFLYCMAINKC